MVRHGRADSLSVLLLLALLLVCPCVAKRYQTPDSPSPGERSACIFDAGTGKFELQDVRVGEQSLADADVWIPPDQTMFMAGYCRFQLNASCDIVTEFAGACESDNPCSVGKCVWWGNSAFLPSSCSPFPECFFAAPQCEFTETECSIREAGSSRVSPKTPAKASSKALVPQSPPRKTNPVLKKPPSPARLSPTKVTQRQRRTNSPPGSPPRNTGAKTKLPAKATKLSAPPQPRRPKSLLPQTPTLSKRPTSPAPAQQGSTKDQAKKESAEPPAPSSTRAGSRQPAPRLRLPDTAKPAKLNTAPKPKAPSAWPQPKAIAPKPPQPESSAQISRAPRTPEQPRPAPRKTVPLAPKPQTSNSVRRPVLPSKAAPQSPPRPSPSKDVAPGVHKPQMPSPSPGPLKPAKPGIRVPAKVKPPRPTKPKALKSPPRPPPVLSLADTPIKNIRDYGAIGDGRTDDSAAMNMAFRAACARTNRGLPSVMLFPSNYSFLSLAPLVFKGPCGAGRLTIQVDGKLRFDAYDLVTTNNDAVWEIQQINGLRFQGSGTINGTGTKWWSLKPPGKLSELFMDFLGLSSFWFKKKARPHLIEFTGCDNLQVRGITTVDPPKMHFKFNQCNNLWVLAVNTLADPGSPNTDSLHVTSCQNVVLERCRLFSGDDCVSIVGNSANVLVRKMSCSAGHGYSIGSLGYKGATACISNITFRDSLMRNCDNGLRIKTYQGGKGSVRNIHYENILMTNVARPIILNQYYCDIKPCPVQSNAVAIFNVTYRNIQATSPDKPLNGGIILNCSDSVPCTGLNFQSINIVPVKKGPSYRPSVRNAFGVSGYALPTLEAMAPEPTSLGQTIAISKQAATCGFLRYPSVANSPYGDLLAPQPSP